VTCKPVTTCAAVTCKPVTTCAVTTCCPATCCRPLLSRIRCRLACLCATCCVVEEQAGEEQDQGAQQQ
jgi:hypothetical protein